jgi:YesN/AraC family two-component response regulator
VILEEEPDITVVGEAPDGRSAIDVVLRRQPDVVLMDIRMPELDGMQAAERILSEPGLDRRCSCSRHSTSTSTSTRRCA